ncbi:hypothetical protein D9M68_598910 [compost metagenome]
MRFRVEVARVVQVGRGKQLIDIARAIATWTWLAVICYSPARIPGHSEAAYWFACKQCFKAQLRSDDVYVIHPLDQAHGIDWVAQQYGAIVSGNVRKMAGLVAAANLRMRFYVDCRRRVFRARASQHGLERTGVRHAIFDTGIASRLVDDQNTWACRIAGQGSQFGSGVVFAKAVLDDQAAGSFMRLAGAGQHIVRRGQQYFQVGGASGRIVDSGMIYHHG